MTQHVPGRTLRDNVNTLSEYINTGLVFEGLLPGRPRDKTGAAFTAGWFSNGLNRANAAEGLARQDYEAVIELNHKFVLGRDLAVQPDFQYVVRPAGVAETSNAFLVGAKVDLHF